MPPPRSRSVSKERLRELVAEWAAGPDHQLKDPILHAANALIDGRRLDGKEGVELIKQAGNFDGQRAALNIAYFASDCDNTEADEALTQADALAREQWEAKGV